LHNLFTSTSHRIQILSTKIPNNCCIKRQSSAYKASSHGNIVSPSKSLSLGRAARIIKYRKKETRIVVPRGQKQFPKSSTCILKNNGGHLFIPH
jgi:hypothetical protein